MTGKTNTSSGETSPVRLVIHGGAGKITRARLTPEREQAYTQVLARSLTAGHAVLAAGGSSIDAVIAAVVVMEDSPLFNAGKGAVFSNAAAPNLMRRSWMVPRSWPVLLPGHDDTQPDPCRPCGHDAKPHVMLIGQGAEAFAAEKGLEIVDPSYFYTQFRWNQLQKAIAEERLLHDHDVVPDTPPPETKKRRMKSRERSGAVALDRQGNLAAGTSTGGITNKRFGRVGDSPIIGAGTYADNRSVAVSGTGTGEMFIRTVPPSTPRHRYGCSTSHYRGGGQFAGGNRCHRRRWRFDRAGCKRQLCNAFQYQRHVPWHYRQRRHRAGEHFLMRRHAPDGTFPGSREISAINPSIFCKARRCTGLAGIAHVARDFDSTENRPPGSGEWRCQVCIVIYLFFLGLGVCPGIATTPE